MSNEDLGASHQGVLVWAIVDDVLGVFVENGLEKAISKYIC